ncbi:MAG: hypothetical protein H6822_11025 [Planctomycetaceae bacterium]|nr:hypothetical protein [Planctomycetales bacterium]MCB9922706.1 hypothetical protein [Planctomycetaceae bacterium]
MKLTSVPLAIVLLQFCGALVAAAETVSLTDATTLEFASVNAGKEALLTPDRYTHALSRFDLESRLRTNSDVTADDLMGFAAEQVVAWSAEDLAKMKPMIASVAQRLAGYRIALPPTILLIQTTGKEEGDAAYTRRHAVILPRRYVGFPVARLEPIFIHELFHVLSSHNEALRNSLYEIIGFKPCPEIELPEPLADRKITNPDGPSLDYYIALDVDGRHRLAVCLLHAPERFDPLQNRTFFQYLKFHLLAVEHEGDDWRLVQVSGEPLLLDPAQTPSFHQQIGSNTKYIIHPDEVLADNFMHLMMKKPSLPNPEIVEKMAKRLNQP